MSDNLIWLYISVVGGEKCLLGRCVLHAFSFPTEESLRGFFKESEHHSKVISTVSDRVCVLYTHILKITSGTVILVYSKPVFEA